MIGTEGLRHSTSMPERSRLWKSLSLERLEWIVAIILSTTVLFLLTVRVTHAGGLWRDECESIQLAQMPRFADILANLGHYSFPVLFTLILRGYTALFGASDFALRCFGFAVGVAFIASTWFHSLSTSRQPPLLLLALMGLNSSFLVIGTWIRGYGIGTVLLVLAFTLTAKLLRESRPMHFVVVALVFVIGSQCLFFNAPLMLGIFLGALGVFLLHRNIRPVLPLVGVGLVIGAAYLPYILNTSFGVRGWTIVEEELLFWKMSLRVFGAPSFIMGWVWLGLILACVVGAAWRLKLTWSKKPVFERDMLLFASIVIVASILLQWAAVWLAHKPPLQRYFVAFFCLLAAATDLVLANLCRLNWVRLIRITAVCIGMITLPFAVWPAVSNRTTNIDILAHKLEKEAGPNDLILVNTWSRGISFNRYYHGTVPWMTVPNIPEHRVHRYDLLRAKMVEFFPLSDIEQAITATLKSENRVWLVNDSESFVPVSQPLVLAPAPDPKYGWRTEMYSHSWSQQLALFLQRHAREVDIVAQRQPGVENIENAGLVLARRWRY